ncbi:hypothetical protein CLV58_109169 [Spirosoma oryzae]|uniref:Uncharacterized protein n=1 Tax=Spirosoma oryzae TaxID=1469603 RepID=A0A2T0SYE5_9BACT|nr:hypothetical protein [Spirosoma oryzae]PRY38442.1 hypothetical protein CLV58_109169 [Spirosoma oryzae]
MACSSCQDPPVAGCVDTLPADCLQFPDGTKAGGLLYQLKPLVSNNQLDLITYLKANPAVVAQLKLLLS